MGGIGTQTPVARSAALGCQSRTTWGGEGRCFRLLLASRGRSAAPGAVGNCACSCWLRGRAGGAMELEPELLLQEARENVEAAQSYRRELGQRLQGLREARRQVGGPRPEELYGRGERARCPAVGRGP